MTGVANDVAERLKVWRTRLDNRVRPAHAAIEGQEVPWNEPFLVAGYEAAYPGDPNLPPGLRINCRCRVEIGGPEGEGRRPPAPPGPRDTVRLANLMREDDADVAVRDSAVPQALEVRVEPDTFGAQRLRPRADGGHGSARLFVEADEIASPDDVRVQAATWFEAYHDGFVTDFDLDSPLFALQQELPTATLRELFDAGLPDHWWEVADDWTFMLPAGETPYTWALKNRGVRAVVTRGSDGGLVNADVVDASRVIRVANDAPRAAVSRDSRPRITEPEVDTSKWADWGERAPEIARYDTGTNFRDIADWEYKRDLELLEQTLNDTLDGYSVRVDVMSGLENVRWFEVGIYDTHGNQIGTASRRIEFDPSEELVNIYNASLTINREHQGMGVGSRVLRELDNWYVAHEVDSTTLHADINVGGYAWARAGYDWDDEYYIQFDTSPYSDTIASALELTTSDAFPMWTDVDAGEMTSKLRSPSAWSRWLDTGDSADFPSPYDISRVGEEYAVRWDDLSHDQQMDIFKNSAMNSPPPPGTMVWPGKLALLGQSWHGRREMIPEIFRALIRSSGAQRGLPSVGTRVMEAAMPWHIEENNGECGGDTPFAVVNSDTGEVVACHTSQEHAQDQVDALYANVEEAEQGEPVEMGMEDAEQFECPGCGALFPGDDVPEVCPECGQALGEAIEAERLDDEEMSDRPFEWEAVLVIEGQESGDKRVIEAEALTWRDLPLPLMLQTRNPEGQSSPHAGAVVCGSIREIERKGDLIIGRGYFDSGEAGQECRRLIDEGTMRGVSVDMDMGQVEFRDEMGAPSDATAFLMGKATMAVVAARIMGATVTPFPAFQEAYLALPDTSLAASGKFAIWSSNQPFDKPGKTDALVASAIKLNQRRAPVEPPAEWFEKSAFEAATPVRTTPEGRVLGHVAKWGARHIGFEHRVDVPKTRAAYRYFRVGQVLTASGTLIATGPVYVDGGHAPLGMSWSEAKDWMADTCAAVADVAVYEDEFGIQIAGALRPTATAEQIRALRGSDLSPDWRWVDGGLEMVGIVAVNTSGFITPALVASARWDLENDHPMALVAAGMVPQQPNRVRELEERVARLEAADLERRLQAVYSPFAQIKDAELSERAAEVLRNTVNLEG